jgi:glycolate oxidase iron-sulfur subunit
MAIIAQMNLKQKILHNADRCVQCGLCLQACPTYVANKNEAESPRGRIALMQALAKQQLPMGQKLQQHLDQCLSCRACEAVCPLNVKYGELIDDTRQLMASLPKRKRSPRLAAWLKVWLTHPNILTLLRRGLRLYQRSKLQWLLRSSKLSKLLGIATYDSLLPPIAPSKKFFNYYPSDGNSDSKKNVGLFLGCVQQLLGESVLHDAIKLLNHCGYGVYVPSQQNCCGALHSHSGQAQRAQQLKQQNLKAFNALPIDAIISVTTGCTPVLQESTDNIDHFKHPVLNIHVFLNQITWPNTLQFKPLPQRVALHTPCSLRNSIKQADAPLKLLQKIPQLEIQALSQSAHCCGAAGSYMLEHPQMAEQLLEQLLSYSKVDFQQIDSILTSNIGCQLHLQRHFQQHKIPLNCLHPVQLLAQQIKSPT